MDNNNVHDGFAHEEGEEEHRKNRMIETERDVNNTNVQTIDNSLIKSDDGNPVIMSLDDWLEELKCRVKIKNIGLYFLHQSARRTGLGIPCHRVPWFYKIIGYHRFIQFDFYDSLLLEILHRLKFDIPIDDETKKMLYDFWETFSFRFNLQKCSTVLHGRYKMNDDFTSVEPLSWADKPMEIKRDDILSDPSKLNFQVKNFFAVGSPLAFFLKNRGDDSITSFLQGPTRILNLYHKYDPVAHRLEPLIDQKYGLYSAVKVPDATKNPISTPLLVCKSVGRAFRWPVRKIKGWWRNSGVEEGQDDDLVGEFSENEENSEFKHRIDYQLKKNNTWSEFISHSIYWSEQGVAQFLAQIILGSLGWS